MGDLEHLDRAQRQRARHLRLGVAGQEEVDRAVAREHDRPVQVWILVGRAGVVGPENAEVETAEGVPPPHAGGNQRDPEPTGRRPQRLLVDP